MLGLLHVRAANDSSTRLPTACTTTGRPIADPGMALDAQNAGQIQRIADAQAHRVDAVGRRRLHHRSVEIVMVVLLLFAVMAARAAMSSSAAELRRSARPATARRASAPCARPAATPWRAAPRSPPTPRTRPDRLSRALPDRRKPVIFEHFLDRIVMIDGVVRRALCGDRAFIEGDTALRQRQRIYNSDDPIDGGAGRPAGQANALSSGCGKAKLTSRSRWRRAAGPAHAIYPSVGTKSSATVQQMQHWSARRYRRGTGFCRALLPPAPVKTRIAEFVDDHGDAAAIRLGQQRAQQRGLAGARKPVSTVTGTRECQISLEA